MCLGRALLLGTSVAAQWGGRYRAVQRSWPQKMEKLEPFCQLVRNLVEFCTKNFSKDDKMIPSFPFFGGQLLCTALYMLFGSGPTRSLHSHAVDFEPFIKSQCVNTIDFTIFLNTNSSFHIGLTRIFGPNETLEAHRVDRRDV